MSKLTELEQVIGYEFNEQRLLQQALTHSSFANEKHMKKLSDNERLEFLGDAVLEVVSSEFLYKEHTDLPEGDLTKLRASIVCEPTLALCTREIDLGKYLYLGKGENLTGGRGRILNTRSCFMTARQFCRKWYRGITRNRFTMNSSARRDRITTNVSWWRR